jgi:outer membrane protein assembly factor BamB
MNRCWSLPACAGICLALAAAASTVVTAETAGGPGWWPQWRGPSGQGVSDDTRVPLTWSEKENLLWKTPLPGNGNSTPVVWGDRIFLTASKGDGDERLVLCVRAVDGKIVWQRTASKGVPPGKTHAWNGFASASCATDGQHVYAFFGTPGLFCYDMDGRPVWQHSFGFFADAAGWGNAASPFLYDDLVIQNCDNDGPKARPAGTKAEDVAPMALVALDKNTGTMRWTTSRDQGRGFSTPRLMAVEAGRIDLLLNGPLGLWGYDPLTGQERWHCPRQDPDELSRFGEPMPVSDGDMLYVSSGRPGPCQGLRLPGAGDVTRTRMVWEGVRKGHRDVSSPVVVDGRVYAADNKAILTCIDLKTGKELYNQRIGNGKNKSIGSPVVVRGKLLFPLDDGVTVVVEPGPVCRVTGRNRLGTGEQLDFGASPAIADGRLFFRSQSYLYCIGTKQ